jgi:hypothetical protein
VQGIVMGDLLGGDALTVLLAPAEAGTQA